MRKIISRLLKLVGAFLLLICILAVGRLFYDTHRYKEFHNPEHVPDLTRYVEHYGDPEDRMFLVRVNQIQYYELIPKKGKYAAWVSGPPVFLYDVNGNLWDYTLDSGDANFAKGGFSIGKIQREGEISNPVQLIQSITGGNNDRVWYSGSDLGNSLI
ncbi:hypothetical protein ACFL6N_05775 [Thermodesulfobacteriota bacterium]